MLVYEFLLWHTMLFFTQGRPRRPPLKRNGYRPVTYKTKISCLTWSLNKVTVFYLSEGLRRTSSQCAGGNECENKQRNNTHPGTLQCQYQNTVLQMLCLSSLYPNKRRIIISLFLKESKRIWENSLLCYLFVYTNHYRKEKQ